MATNVNIGVNLITRRKLNSNEYVLLLAHINLNDLTHLVTSSGGNRIH